MVAADLEQPRPEPLAYEMSMGSRLDRRIAVRILQCPAELRFRRRP
ncbi:MAG: hypothetical protein GY856_55060 [bacterium]|nr:hypothetical protein [bacterium]